MPYGTIKVDNITFTDNSVDKTVSLSGLIQNPTFTGNVTATGTISGDVIRGGTTISGVTVTGTTANFVSGVFTTRISGATITGTTVATTTGSFVSLTGTTATFTSGIIASGTAALPSLAILSDPNTGIYSPGADELAISTGGSGRLFVDASGRVGVGVTSPAATWYVQAASARSSLVSTTGTNAAYHTFINTGGNFYIGLDNSAGGDFSAPYAGAIWHGGAYPLIFGTSNAERLRITSAGLVGVGTSSPSYKFEVDNTGGSTATARLVGNDQANVRLRIQNTGASGRAYEIVGGLNGANNSHLSIYDATAAATRLTITDTGLVGIGTSSPSQLLTLQQTSAGSAVDCLFLNNSSISSGTAVGISFGPNTTNDITRSAIIRGINESGGAGNATGLGFFTNANGGAPTQKVTITSAGLVGIGTTSPGALLHLNGGTSADQLRLGTDSSFYKLGRNSVNGPFEFYGTQSGVTGYVFSGVDGERARIDTSGRFLVGTPTARSNFYNSTNSPQLQIEGNDNSKSALAIIQDYNANTIGAQLVLAKNNSTTIGTNVLVANADTLGVVSFQGNDGSEFVEAATIEVEVDGTPGANDMPGRLVFSTTADGASSPTERMRIQQNGYTWMGHSSVSVSPWDATSGTFAKFADIYPIGATSQSNIVAIFNRNTTTGSLVECKYNGNVVGNITVTASSTAYNTSSDYRLKENVTAVTDGITRLQQLKPSRFNFIADSDTVVDGFIAHEVQEVVPECVAGTKDEVDEDGNPVYQGIDQSKLVPLLTAALQEAISEINALKDRLTAAGIA